MDGNGFTFRAPAAWSEERKATMITLSPGKDAPQLVGVSIFRLVRPYRPTLFRRVVPELDSVAKAISVELGGRVTASRTLTVAGRKSRQYDLVYPHGGERMEQTITFVLEGRREYQLLCRRSAGEKLAACRRLVKTFRIS